MKPYALYIKSAPGVEYPKNWKIGVADLSNGKLRKRLATYQIAVGPEWDDKYTRLFVGDEKQIKLAEKEFKREYKEKIHSKEAGFSEWITDITLDELVQFVDELREDYAIKIFDVPQKFEPCYMANCEDVEDWFAEFFTELLFKR